MVVRSESVLKFNFSAALAVLFSILFSCPARLPGCFTVSPFHRFPRARPPPLPVALAAAAAVCLSVWQLAFETEAFEAEKFETV